MTAVMTSVKISIHKDLAKEISGLTIIKDEEVSPGHTRLITITFVSNVGIGRSKYECSFRLDIGKKEFTLVFTYPYGYALMDQQHHKNYANSINVDDL